MPDDAEQEVIRTAARYGIDLEHGRRNGDKISVAVLERVVTVDTRIEELQIQFADHVRREEQLYGAFVLMGLGAVLSIVPAIAHSISQSYSLITGDDVSISIPPAVIEIAETVGGALMLAGALTTVSPRIMASMVGRFFIRMGGK